MATQTYTIRNSVDGKYDTFHWDPTDPHSGNSTITYGNATIKVTGKPGSGGTGTSNGQKDTNRDTDRGTAEAR